MYHCPESSEAAEYEGLRMLKTEAGFVMTADGCTSTDLADVEPLEEPTRFVGSFPVARWGQTVDGESVYSDLTVGVTARVTFKPNVSGSVVWEDGEVTGLSQYNYVVFDMMTAYEGERTLGAGFITWRRYFGQWSRLGDGVSRVVPVTGAAGRWRTFPMNIRTTAKLSDRDRLHTVAAPFYITSNEHEDEMTVSVRNMRWVVTLPDEAEVLGEDAPPLPPSGMTPTRTHNHERASARRRPSEAEARHRLREASGNRVRRHPT